MCSLWVALGDTNEMGVLNPGEGPPFFCHWGRSREIVLPELEGQ